jgi:PAS domain S-box-containing protein
VTHVALTYITISLLVLFIIMLYLLRAVYRHRKKEDEDTNKDSTEVGFVVDTFHDLVTALKDKERELEILREKAEERASSVEIYNEDILQSVPSGVVSFDKGLTITKMNSAAEKILELKESESVGKEYHEIFGNPLLEFIGRMETIDRTETAYVTKTGRRIWLGLNMSPLKDSSGKIIGRILVFTDLTELKSFQSQMELRERLSNLGEMSAGIAHELRNPMAVISGYTKILSKKVDSSLSPAVEAISKEVSVMDRIITDFLSFAKPTELILTKVNLIDLLEGCAAVAEDGSIAVRVVKDFGSLPIVMADEVLLRQSIINLLQNSVESMQDGGTLTIKVRLEGCLSISISDTGHGIQDAIKDKIFLPFFTTKERGTGLGLSIVHKVVVSHGGSMHLETGPQGTTFTLNFPISMIV